MGALENVSSTPMHSTFAVGFLGVPRRQNFFISGSTGTGDSLLMLLLLMGVAVLVEASLSVRKLDSLATKEELQELSKIAVSRSD